MSSYAAAALTLGLMAQFAPLAPTSALMLGESGTECNMSRWALGSFHASLIYIPAYHWSMHLCGLSQLQVSTPFSV